MPATSTNVRVLKVLNQCFEPISLCNAVTIGKGNQVVGSMPIAGVSCTQAPCFCSEMQVTGYLLTIAMVLSVELLSTTIISTFSLG